MKTCLEKYIDMVKNASGDMVKEMVLDLCNTIGYIKEAKESGNIDIETFIVELGWQDWMNAFLNDSDIELLDDDTTKEIDGFIRKLWEEVK